MRSFALILALLAAAPTLAQQPPAPPAAPTLSPQDRARADALLIEALAHLMAERRDAAAPLIRQGLAIMATPEDLAAMQGDNRLDTFKRWIAARSAAMEARDYAGFTHWAWLIAADGLIYVAEKRGFDPKPISAETFDDIPYLAYGMALAGQQDRVRAYAAPFIAANDPAFETAFATDFAQRVLSMRAWGGERKPLAEALANLGLSIFDRPAGHAADPVRNLWNELGTIRRTAGDIAGARDAYRRARAPRTPLADVEIALMFDAGETEAGLAAIRDAVKLPPAAPLTVAAADKLVEINGQTGSGNAGSIRILRLALDTYRRLLKTDDRKVEDSARMLAHLHLAAGDPAAAEALLAPLLAIAETRWGPESNGAIDYAVALATAIEAQNRHGEAELIYRRIWDLSVKYDSYDSTDSNDSFAGIARTLVARGMRDAALAFTADGLARTRKAQDVNAWRRMTYLLTRATVLETAGQLAEAETLVREAIALGEPDDKLAFAAGFNDPDMLARDQLAGLLEAQGKPGEAEPIRRLILLTIEKNDMIPWEGVERRAALLALAANLTRQGKAEGDRLFGDRLATSTRIFGIDSPQSLDVAEPFARALLGSGRAGAALTPARIALAARTSARFTGDTARASASDVALGRKRTEAARLMVEAAWKASR